MDFMEPLVLFRNRWLLVFLFGITACRNGKTENWTSADALPVPTYYKPGNDTELNKRQDTLYIGNSLYNGYIYQLYEKGDTQFIFGYVNGLEEGIFKKWYPNRQIQEVRFYHRGKKNGTCTNWWDNGNKKFEFSTIDDLYEGKFSEWNREGKLIKDFNYRHGQEQGSEKLWWNDGTIRANYVVDNGRKYGLIGLKLCRNVYDSLK